AFSKRSVANGELATFSIFVAVPANAAAGSAISNTASAGTADPNTVDTVPGNNSQTAMTTVQTRADLSITSKTATPNPVSAGNNLTYTINCVNNGPSDAQVVTV